MMILHLPNKFQGKGVNSMKRLPDSELEIMMIIWELDKPVTRAEIEEKMAPGRKLSPTTILSFLSRLQEKGFLAMEKGLDLSIFFQHRAVFSIYLIERRTNSRI